MKYGVIVCPKCGMARGVETRKKTTSCQCGREIVLSRVKVHFMTDSPLELADAVAEANASIRGGKPLPAEKKPRKKGAYAAAAERAKPIKDPVERMRAVAEALTEAKGQFTLDDLRKAASVLGKDSAEDMLARLLEHNLVYESGEGIYRSV